MKSFVAKFAAVAAVAAIGLSGVASAHRDGGDSGGDGHNAGHCTGRPFALVKISDLHGAEKVRASPSKNQ